LSTWIPGRTVRRPGPRLTGRCSSTSRSSSANAILRRADFFAKLSTRPVYVRRRSRPRLAPKTDLLNSRMLSRWVKLSWIVWFDDPTYGSMYAGASDRRIVAQTCDPSESLLRALECQGPPSRPVRRGPMQTRWKTSGRTASASRTSRRLNRTGREQHPRLDRANQVPLTLHDGQLISMLANAWRVGMPTQSSGSRDVTVLPRKVELSEGRWRPDVPLCLEPAWSAEIPARDEQNRIVMAVGAHGINLSAEHRMHFRSSCTRGQVTGHP
jgi:hypothetical protein